MDVTEESVTSTSLFAFNHLAAVIAPPIFVDAVRSRGASTAAK
jgi:hypothetical protein